MMKLVQTCIIALTLASMYSCAPLNPVARKDLSAPINNKACYRPYSELSQKCPDDFLHILKIDSVHVDSVCVVFSQSEMIVSYRDINTNQFRTQTYKGKMRKKDFQVFFRRDHTGIPPFFWVREVDRYRFSISPDKSLVVTEMHDHTAMILLMAGGSGYRNQNIFSAFP
ncbi:hypothetical protein [Flavobacterium silvaticum]|uniref:Lipoprotein n=1 Tax=Flavobacterium silvaticum TaxID=1852020 RepID=A0A972JIU5_9FLAO|nr:hypothetical protein [Flavobacterium silvaticum]NMH27552.1 hypothetical protein [Flavobacterium silvaticum]